MNLAVQKRFLLIQISSYIIFSTIQSTASVVLTFLGYVKFLKLNGLEILDFENEAFLSKTLDLIYGKYALLPKDMIFLKLCDEKGIKHIATQDPDFDNCMEVKVWKPKE